MSMSLLKPLPFRSLQEMVADNLRQAILSGVLKPGQRILDAEIARQMGISRSPVREALRQLERDGLVRSTPNRGVSVRCLSHRDLAELYGIRSVLEGLAAVWACRRVSSHDLEHLQRLCEEMNCLVPFKSDEERLAFLRKDVEFHEALVAASGSAHLAEALSTIRLQTQLIMATTSEFGHVSPQTAAEHEAVLEALLKRDAELAESRLRRHVEGARDRMLARFADTEPE
ncbi:MAG: GntR family transcriptional regulator [Chloroflexota bacterium]